MRQSNQSRKSALKHIAPEVPIGNGAATSNHGPTEAEIRERAYAIYLGRRGAPGDCVADWLRAERELRAEIHGLPAEEQP